MASLMVPARVWFVWEWGTGEYYKKEIPGGNTTDNQQELDEMISLVFKNKINVP